MRLAAPKVDISAFVKENKNYKKQGTWYRNIRGGDTSMGQSVYDDGFIGNVFNFS